MKMAKFCKNCGAYISENDAFCTDCGKSTLKTCPKCREQLTAHSKFCPNCGYEIKSSRLPIIIVALAVIAIVAAIAIFPITITSMQEVQVDTFSFNIPNNFEKDPASIIDENNNGIITKSKCWNDSTDFIEIEVLYSKNPKTDMENVNAKMGGQEENLIGHNGYYNEFSDAYSFSFVDNNKLCTVYTSNPDLLTEIELV